MAFGNVLNDILDLESDKAHYIKKYRMLPSGKISVKKASFIAFVIFMIGTLFLATLDFIILLVCIFYLAMSIFYSRYLKYIKFIDILYLVQFIVQSQSPYYFGKQRTSKNGEHIKTK